MNKFIGIGNLARDVELRYLNTGAAVATSCIALQKKTKKQDGTYMDSTCFVDIILFGRTAEVLNQYCKKGSKIGIEGELTLDQWTDQNGNKRSKHKILCNTIELLYNKSEAIDTSHDSDYDESQVEMQQAHVQHMQTQHIQNEVHQVAQTQNVHAQVENAPSQTQQMQNHMQTQVAQTHTQQTQNEGSANNALMIYLKNLVKNNFTISPVPYDKEKCFVLFRGTEAECSMLDTYVKQITTLLQPQLAASGYKTMDLKKEVIPNGSVEINMEEEIPF